MKDEQQKSQYSRMAICYDFDKTLSPDDMQTFTLIPSFGVDKHSFWEESDALAKENLMDTNLAWMYQLINYSRLKRTPIKKEYFNRIGADILLYKGVESWFDRINKYAEKRGITVEHYIISSGLKEIIEGSKIAHNFKRIYASTYLYSADEVAEWPAQAVNYTNKTQFIFRIAKGYFEEYDDRVNDSMPSSERYIPYENIVYIGDSATDIPCMRLVKSRGGYSIGVFDPEKNNRKKVYQLFNDNRLTMYAPADYSAGSDLSRFMNKIIDEISVRGQIKEESERLQQSASAYHQYQEIKQTIDQYASTMDSDEKKQLESTLKEIRKMIEGNID